MPPLRLAPRFYPPLLRFKGQNLPLIIIKYLPDLHIPQVVDALAQLAVVMEEPPAALELDDGMVRGPAQHGLQDPPCVREGAEGRVPDGVDEVVRVAGRVAEVVLSRALVHPGGLEEAAVVVVGGDGRAGLGRQDDEVARGGREAPHVWRQGRDLGEQRDLAGAGRLLRARPRLVERRDAVRVRLAADHGALVALQLAAPEPAEVQVRVARVRVDEGRGVDAEAPRYRLGVGHERAGRGVADGDADAEHGRPVARREVQVVLAVLEGRIGRPELLRRPRHVLGAQHHAVVGHGVGGVGGVQRRRREDVVVGHVVLVAVVVELDVRLAVVRGVDVDAPLEDVGRGVRRVEVGY